MPFIKIYENLRQGFASLHGHIELVTILPCIVHSTSSSEESEDTKSKLARINAPILGKWLVNLRDKFSIPDVRLTVAETMHCKYITRGKIGWIKIITFLK